MNLNKRVYLCCRAMIPIMREQNAGRMVNIASNIAVTGGVGRAHYAAAKHVNGGFVMP